VRAANQGCREHPKSRTARTTVARD
jgi:hypothetical protein